MMDACIFCALKENSTDKILFEDSTCFVALDKFPAERGHLLVVPKEHYETVLDAPDDVVAHVFVTAKRFAVLCKERLGAPGINIGTNAGKDAGQAVPHLHVHIIPRYGRNRHAGFVKHREITADEIVELKRQLSTQ